MNAKYYELLKQFVSFKSISPNKDFNNEIIKTSQRLHQYFDDHDYQVEYVEGYGNPIVIASYIFDEKLPTCMIYGHYDVQHAEISEGWKTDPFSLLMGKEKIYGRGSVDNKGQILTHMISVEELKQQNNLGCNVIFLIEGEEEVGSPGLFKFFQENPEKIAPDIVLISDGTLFGGKPCIEVGFRGVFDAKLILKTAHTDVHSGIYGGIAPNPILEVNKLLAKLYDTNNQITIPYFYYEVEDIPYDMLYQNKNISFDQVKFQKDTGIQKTLQEKGRDIYTQTGLRPTIQMTGIKSGIVNHFKSAIPNQVEVNFNFRLVKNQDSGYIQQSFKDWIKNTLPGYVEYDIHFTDAIPAVKLQYDRPYIQRAVDILQKVYDDDVLYHYCGGSLPIVDLFANQLGWNVLSVPFANEDCNMHGIDENFDIELIKKGYEFSSNFFQK